MGAPETGGATAPGRAAGRRSRLIVRVCVFNILAFGLAALFLGGDAVNEGADAGRYFLSDQGTLTEVGRVTWRYSQAHRVSIWFSMPALLGAMLAARRVRPALRDPLLVPVLAGGAAALVIGELLKAAPGPLDPARAAASLVGGTVVGAGVALLAGAWNRQRQATPTNGRAGG